MPHSLWESYNGKVESLTLTSPTNIEVDEPHPDDMIEVEQQLIEEVAKVIIGDLGLTGWTVTVQAGTSSSTIPPDGYRVRIMPQTKNDC